MTSLTQSVLISVPHLLLLFTVTVTVTRIEGYESQYQPNHVAQVKSFSSWYLPSSSQTQTDTGHCTDFPNCTCRGISHTHSASTSLLPNCLNHNCQINCCYYWFLWIALIEIKLKRRVLFRRGTVCAILTCGFDRNGNWSGFGKSHNHAATRHGVMSFA